MQEFKVGDRVVEVKTGDEGEVLGFGLASGSLRVDWITGQEAGKILFIEPSQCVLKTDQSLTIESCLKFLTEQGFSVTLTKG